MHDHLVFDGLLPGDQVRRFRRSRDHSVRHRRQSLRNLRHGTGLYERGVFVRRGDLQRMLRQRRLHRDADRPELRRGGRRLRVLRRQAGMHGSGQMRVHAEFVPQRLL
jgi:hypothetical protein